MVDKAKGNGAGEETVVDPTTAHIDLSGMPEELGPLPGAETVSEETTAAPEKPTPAGTPQEINLFEQYEKDKKDFEDNQRRQITWEAPPDPKLDFAKEFEGLKIPDGTDDAETIFAKHRELVEKLPDILSRHDEMLRKRMDTRVLSAEIRAKQKVNDNDEARTMRENPNYAKVLEAAGVTDALSVVKDAQGNSVFKDPFLWNRINAQPEPARWLFAYAVDKLRKEGKEIPGAEPARAGEVQKEAVTIEAVPPEKPPKANPSRDIRAVVTNAAKPRGVQGLPSGRPATQGLVVADIEKMNDGQKMWIKKNRKDLWDAYLGK